MSRSQRSIAAGLLISCVLSGGVHGGGGFECAIDSALPRSVKLYGLKVGQQVGYGTGTIVSAEGHIVTVYTLLLESNKLRVVTADGTRYRAKLVSFDREKQLALIKMTTAMDDRGAAGPFAYFDVACEQTGGSPCDPDLLPGDWVVAAGNAFKIAEGAEPASVSHGVYSTRTRLDARRKVKEFPYRGDVLVIDAVTSNPGAPGSPLVNLEGELVGLIGRLVVSNLTHTRFNYAIPRDVLRDFLLTATGRGEERPASAEDSVASAALGSDVGPVDTGIRVARTGYIRLPPFVERVRRRSPAAKAGVRKDDLILSVNGHSVPDVASYDKRMERIRATEPVDLVIQRKKRVLTLRIPPPDQEESQ